MDVSNMTNLELLAKVNIVVIHPLFSLMAVYGIYLFVSGFNRYFYYKKTNEDLKTAGQKRMETGLILFGGSFILFTGINFLISALGK